MPNSVDEKHSPSEFYYPGETNYPNATCQGERITPKKTTTKTATKKCFLVFSTKSEKNAIQQSHIINPLLTSFARSVRESIAFGFYRTDLAPSSLDLYENLRQYFPVQTSHSVNKSLIYNKDLLTECEVFPVQTEQTRLIRDLLYGFIVLIL